MRLGLLIGALTLALLGGIMALQTPKPRDLSAPAKTFSAARAMADVREIAQRPHPVGSADHQRVQTYLVGRMTELGLSPALQVGELSERARTRLTRWGLDPSAEPVNIVGILKGRDPTANAVLVMAHYDSTAESPGAADDAAGVAAILEGVRAIKARGPADRDLIVLMTDAEELALDGAVSFFKAPTLPAHVGVVVNLEARGGGGRAMMFETGPDNRQTIDLFARTSRKADGGATSNSLAVLVYEQMPNGTDFTVARERGIPGLNLAFIGRPEQYHSASSTPDNLDQGSLQHIGSQSLEAVDALLRSPALPVATEPRVYADAPFVGILGHRPQTGWLLLALAAGLAGFAGWKARVAGQLELLDLGRGLLGGVGFVAAGLVVSQAVRLLAGPLSGRATSPDAYYVLLARLPWIEAGVAFGLLAVGLVALGRVNRRGRIIIAGTIAAAAAVALALGGVSAVVVVAAVLALGLSLSPKAEARSAWGGWLGLILMILLAGIAVQAVAPGAAFLLIWPALLAGVVAAVAALIDPRLERPASLAPAAIATALGGTWIVSLSHPVFLGIGMDLPAVLAPLGLLILMFARPLAPRQAGRRLTVAAAACLVLACGLSLTARAVVPMTQSDGDAAMRQ